MYVRDFYTYMALYRTILDAIPRPKVLRCLQSSVKTLQQRIAKRGLPTESAIPVTYLKKLDRLYSEWISNYEMSPVVHINTEKIDYLEDFIERERITRELNQHITV